MARPAPLLVAVFLPLGLSACVEVSRSSPRWDRLRQELGDAPRTDAAPGQPRRGQQYAVRLRAFGGGQRIERAFAFARRVRETGQIPALWFVNQGDEAVVYAGRFPRPDSDDAQRSLRQVREAELDGTRPFRRAKLVALAAGGDAVTDPWDLRQHRNRRSLAVEIFDSDVTEDFRRTAEKRAAELRRETELDVYYFLGQRQSYVAAGLFHPVDDFEPDEHGIDVPGPAIRAMRERFPHVRRNGQYIINPDSSAADPREPSVIIRVP